MKDILYIFK